MSKQQQTFSADDVRVKIQDNNIEIARLKNINAALSSMINDTSSYEPKEKESKQENTSELAQQEKSHAEPPAPPKRKTRDVKYSGFKKDMDTMMTGSEKNKWNTLLDIQEYLKTSIHNPKLHTISLQEIRDLMSNYYSGSKGKIWRRYSLLDAQYISVDKISEEEKALYCNFQTFKEDEL